MQNAKVTDSNVAKHIQQVYSEPQLHNLFALRTMARELRVGEANAEVIGHW